MISLLHRPTFAPAGTHSHRTASPASNLLDAAEVQRVFINMYENGELTRALETEANSVMTMLQVMMVQGAVEASNYSTVEAAARFNTSFATMEELMQKPSTGCIPMSMDPQPDSSGTPWMLPPAAPAPVAI